MDTDIATLCERVERTGAAALDNLTRTEAAVRDLEREMGAMPFFVRGFVSSSVSKGSGQDVPAWVRTIGALTADIRSAQEAAGRARAAGALAGEDRARLPQTAEHIRVDQPRFERLVGFLEEAPSRLDTVPKGVLPPERRGELLAMLDAQVRSLRATVAAMPALAEAVQALASS